MSHGEARLGVDWPRRIGLVILTLTSLMVVVGIVTAAHNGTLLSRPRRGAVFLAAVVALYWIFYWYSARRPVRIAFVLWMLLFLIAWIAFDWLRLVAAAALSG